MSHLTHLRHSGHYTDKKTHFLHILESFCPYTDPLWLKWVKWLIWVFLCDALCNFHTSLACLRSINPRLPKVFCVTRHLPSLDFCYKASDSYDFGTLGYIWVSSFYWYQKIPVAFFFNVFTDVASFPIGIMSSFFNSFFVDSIPHRGWCMLLQWVYSSRTIT